MNGAVTEVLFPLFFVKVVAPYDSEDSRGLLKAAVRDPDPVVFLENEILYGQKFPVAQNVLDPDFTLPLDKAKIMREGTDVTLIGFGKMVGYNIQAAELLAQEGISCEVSHLRLQPMGVLFIRKSVLVLTGRQSPVASSVRPFHPRGIRQEDTPSHYRRRRMADMRHRC